MNASFYIQVLTWDEAPRSHLEQVQSLIAAGASWIQLRQKNGTYDEKLAVASACVALCKKASVTLIINDDPRLCLECGADGVHLGLSDMPIVEARALLGSHCIIGGTANTPNQVAGRMDAGADYVGVGPWRFTGTKKGLSPVLGKEGVRAVAQMVEDRKKAGMHTCPFVVIGGIVPTDVAQIQALGANGLAISSAIVGVPNMDEAYRAFEMAI